MKANKAVLIAVCDVSGSMGRTKKMVAKEYFGFVKATLKSMYEEVLENYVGHTTVAYEKQTEEDLFNFSSKSGGTFLSSGCEKVSNIVKSVNRNDSDIYVIHFSDGDNWGEDNDKTVELMNKNAVTCDFVQFVEIRNTTYTSTIMSRFEKEKNENLSLVKMGTDSDILEVFKSTRNTLKSLSSKMKEIRVNDMVRKEKYSEIKTIERFDSTTVVTLQDGTVGVSKCSPKDTYDEEMGFTVAHLRARIESDTNSLNKIISLVTYVEVLDNGETYDRYEELGKKYETEDLKFVRDFVPLNGQHLELIEYTGYNLAICKDSCNRIIIINKNGIKEIK